MSYNRNSGSRFNPQPYPGRPQQPPSLLANASLPYYQQIKTPEQIAFDQEFEKWEKSFQDWKKSFQNHPDQASYRTYEAKFLEVRDKLLRKRVQIYGSGTPSFANPFENQLSAAGAMAESILSKFGEPDRRSNALPVPPTMGLRDPYLTRSDNYLGPSERKSRWSDDRNNCSRDDNRGRHNDSRHRSKDGDRGYRNDDRNRPIDDHRRSMSGRRDDRRGPGSQNNDRGRSQGSRDDRRGGGSGGGRNNTGNRGMDINRGQRDFPREPPIPKPTEKQLKKDLARKNVYPRVPWQSCSTEERPALVGKRAKKKNTKILNFLERKKRIESGEMVVDQEPAATKPSVPNDQIPFAERLEIMFEEARKNPCPKLLPGSGKRRLANIKKKNELSLSAEDRKFLEYVDFIHEKRSKYFEEQKALANTNNTEAEVKDSEKTCEDTILNADSEQAPAVMEVN